MCCCTSSTGNSSLRSTPAATADATAGSRCVVAYLFHISRAVFWWNRCTTSLSSNESSSPRNFLHCFVWLTFALQPRRRAREVRLALDARRAFVGCKRWNGLLLPIRHHRAIGETAFLKAKAWRSPHGAYDHRCRSRKVCLSSGRLASSWSRRRGETADAGVDAPLPDRHAAPRASRPCGRLRRCATRSLDPCSRRGHVAAMRRRKTFVAFNERIFSNVFFSS
jgi:hypothetical protein